MIFHSFMQQQQKVAFLFVCFHVLSCFSPLNELFPFFSNLTSAFVGDNLSHIRHRPQRKKRDPGGIMGGWGILFWALKITCIQWFDMSFKYLERFINEVITIDTKTISYFFSIHWSLSSFHRKPLCWCLCKNWNWSNFQSGNKLSIYNFDRYNPSTKSNQLVFNSYHCNNDIFQCIYVVCSTLFSTYIHIYYINIPHLWLNERQKSEMCFGRV